MKKFLAIVISLAMTMGLAACGGNTDKPSEANTNATTSDGKNVVNIKWVTVGGGMPENYDKWQKQVNDYIGPKIGVNVDMNVVSWGDWDQRRSAMVNTSGDYDIMFTNSNTYYNDVSIGAFLDISDMVQKSAPELYKMIPESYWEACKVGGKVYAVPTYKDSSQSEIFVWDKELATSAGVDMANVRELPQLTDAFKAIKEKSGKPVYVMDKADCEHFLYQYDKMGTGMSTIGVKFDDQKAKVVPVFEQPEVMETLKLIHEWYKNGYINADAATKSEPDKYRAFGIVTGWTGAAKTVWGPGMGVEAEAYQWGPTIVSNETVRGSLNCISAGSKHPEKALELLQLVNTDPYVRDLFFYGVEGEDWEYTADKKVHRLKTDWKMAGYTQATFFTVTPTDDVDFNQWDEVRALNEGAKPSVLLGFTFDIKPIENELANCVTIYQRYKGEILTGTTDPEKSVPAMMKEMRAAGFDKIVEEAQKQIDAFMAAK